MSMLFHARAFNDVLQHSLGRRTDDPVDDRALLALPFLLGLGLILGSSCPLRCLSEPTGFAG